MNSATVSIMLNLMPGMHDNRKLARAKWKMLGLMIHRFESDSIRPRRAFRPIGNEHPATRRQIHGGGES